MRTLTRLFLTLGLLGSLAGLFTACELNDDASDPVGGPDALSITPGYVELSTRLLDPVVFTVSGGTPPYAWSLSNTNGTLGTLSARDGTAVYTPRAVVGSLFLIVRDQSGADANATLIQK